jgi:hypothetical protein
MAYATPDSLFAFTELRIHQRVVDRLVQRANFCAACGVTPAPRGVFPTSGLAKWAADRAVATGERPDEANRRAALHMHDDRCAVCYSSLAPVIGVPEALLYRVLNRLRPKQNAIIRGFLQERFVFLMCRACLEDPNEDRISADEIMIRYEKVQTQIDVADLNAPQFRQIAEQLYSSIVDAIQLAAETG